MSNPGVKFAGAVHQLVSVAMAADVPATAEVVAFVVALATTSLSDEDFAVLVTQHRDVVDAIVHELHATVARAAADGAEGRRRGSLN